MGKRKEEVNENVRAWLLSFEELAGRAVVVSLLIEDGKINFVAAINKQRALPQDYDDEAETPEINIKDNKPKIKYPFQKNSNSLQSYIG